MHISQCVQRQTPISRLEAERCRFAEISDILEQVRQSLPACRRDFMGWIKPDDLPLLITDLRNWGTSS